MSLYDAIFVRRAIHKFEAAPLDTATLSEIADYAAAVDQMDGETATFEIVAGEAVTDSLAPHYLMAFCPESDGAHANVGYTLQKVDLWLQSRGLGSHWVGIGKPKVAKPGFCIFLAFGRAAEGLRTSESDFDRLPLAKISDTDNPVARAARLAPSAVNNQPWYLKFGDDEVTITHVPRGLLKLVLKGKMDKISLGIVTRHVVVALEHEGREILAVKPQLDGKDFAVRVTYR
jgi:hypothetical protein